MLKAKYAELQIEEIQIDKYLSDWQKEIVDERLRAYYSNPAATDDFTKVLDQIEKEL